MKCSKYHVPVSTCLVHMCLAGIWVAELTPTCMCPLHMHPSRAYVPCELVPRAYVPCEHVPCTCPSNHNLIHCIELIKEKIHHNRKQEQCSLPQRTSSPDHLCEPLSLWTTSLKSQSWRPWPRLLEVVQLEPTTRTLCLASPMTSRCLTSSCAPWPREPPWPCEPEPNLKAFKTLWTVGPEPKLKKDSNTYISKKKRKQRRYIYSKTKRMLSPI